MKDTAPSRQSKQFKPQETFFRLISPEEYARFGIDPQDIPMGTFAAEDHPGFLLSRLGGNAYGLGLIEQSALSKADTDFLQSFDAHDPFELGRHSKRLNTIYHKLGLLIRFSESGKRYFLIPINLVAHSLQDVKIKADVIEEQILQHTLETATERLNIGLLTAEHDLIVHELTARLSTHRIFLFESLEKIRSWRLPLDAVILSKDIFEYLQEQQLPKTSKSRTTHRRIMYYAGYLAGKIYDILESNGKLIMLANPINLKGDRFCKVNFQNDEELKLFLLFAHIYKTRKQYLGRTDLVLNVYVSDLHYYLNRFAFSEPYLQRLLQQKRPEELSLEEIDKLPHLNLRLPQVFVKDPEKKWRRAIEPYFQVNCSVHDSAKRNHRYWQDRMELKCRLPESLTVLVARPRQPQVTLESLEEEVRNTGMQGCSLQLAAAYRNSFRYVLAVLSTLLQVRDNNFSRLSELERARLTNPFQTKQRSFEPILQLLNQFSKIGETREILNPDHIDGQPTPVLENIHKLNLHGFSREQLREILLIIVGHSTMSRIVFGKLPPKTLEPVTDRAKTGNYQEVFNILRVCRLMSVAEIVAAFGDGFTAAQARELYRLYDDAVFVATNPSLSWDDLQDHRISAIGGVQNKAIREMLKFFNLFEFLDNWQSFLDKSSFQKEVFCDYQPDKMVHLQQAITLAAIANEFKIRFLGDYIFGKLYFFRQFLDTEFHGTGHLFPKLGPKAGFILLWISVNSSNRRIVNFNPILAGISQDRSDQRIGKIKESLLRIPIARLQPEVFDDIQTTLAAGRPVFIFDSGIRLTHHQQTRAIDIAFVDVDENLHQIEALLTHLESLELRGISLRNLQEMERLFAELESFHQYILRAGCDLQCDFRQNSGGHETKISAIERVEQRLLRTLRKQVFVPEEIYDSVSVLAKHCPEILSFVLPEFHAYGNLVENWPTLQKQLLGGYIMRCLEKFQALIVRDRNAFQDRNTYYRLAKREFGPLAEEGIGATHAQMETLEYLVDRIRQRPTLCQALTLALLFQEIGKIEQYGVSLPSDADWWTHAEAGALILERSEVLEKYQLDPQVEELVMLLVRHHGLIGHVIQGEEPMTALDQLIAPQDDRLLDVFVLHSILAAAAVQEGLMVADLVDVFLAYRAAALEIIKSAGNWQDWLTESCRDKGKAALSDPTTDSLQALWFPAAAVNGSTLDTAGREDEALRRGRRIAALERLFKLMGAPWIDFQDIQMYRSKMPVAFIHHKKKLKSVGPAAFEQQLSRMEELLELLASLPAAMRFHLFCCLDHLDARLRIYDFHLLANFFRPDECLKLLLAALRAYRKHFGDDVRDGLVSFRHLSQRVEQRRDVVRMILAEIHLDASAAQNDSDAPCRFEQAHGSLYFMKNRHQKAIQVRYRDTVRMDQMVHALTSQTDHAELTAQYQGLIVNLQHELPYDTQEIEQQLHTAYLRQREKINDEILRSFQERLSSITSFLKYRGIRNEIKQQLTRLDFTDAQRSLLEEMCDFHLARLRELYLDDIYQQINRLESHDDLQNYWDQLKHELFSLRTYVGKEYESLIAEVFDRKMQKLRA